MFSSHAEIRFYRSLMRLEVSYPRVVYAKLQTQIKVFTGYLVSKKSTLAKLLERFLV
jgi:hypothetical protein